MTTNSLKLISNKNRIRLDIFLSENIENQTRTRIKNWVENGNVKINGVECLKPAQKLKQNDVVDVFVPDPVSSDVLAEKIPLNIIYEDEHMIVVNKEAGMIVHPTNKIFSGTLVNALLYHCKDLSGVGGKLKPGIVHRLDIGTSGAMVVAKNDNAHVNLSKQFQNRNVKKTYLALVYGNPVDEGRIESAIGRSIANRKKFSSKTKKGRSSITTWKVARRFGTDLSLLEVNILTGRTHQIRVHLTEKGFPIAGDPLYGKRNDKRSLDEKIKKSIKTLSRPFLHSWKLEIRHPVSGKLMKLTAKLPKDLNLVLNKLKKQKT